MLLPHTQSSQLTKWLCSRGYRRNYKTQKTIILLSYIVNIVGKFLHQKWNRTRFVILGVNSHFQIIGTISNQICHQSFKSKLHKTQSSSHSYCSLNTRHMKLEQAKWDHYKKASENLHWIITCQSLLLWVKTQYGGRKFLYIV
jgi:hypothetical protein